MVNEAFARKYFAGEDPIGQHMRSGLGEGTTPPMREVVGVVGDVKRANLTEGAQPEYYIPIEQAPVAPPAVALRVDGSPAAYENMVLSTVAALDRGLPVYRLHPYSDELARTTAQQRFQAVLLSTFAGLALLMAAVGLYALLSYMVAQRTTELGLRIALGAQRGEVLGLILKRGLVLSSVGLILGLAVAVFLTRILSGMLFGVRTLDAPTFVAVSVVLMTVACLASLIPAYRASRLDPITAMRTNE
jgi:predicted lysophospholipase L1 biosynthesis ABC-type transport system permease subunit